MADWPFFKAIAVAFSEQDDTGLREAIKALWMEDEGYCPSDAMVQGFIDHLTKMANTQNLADMEPMGHA